MKKVTFLTCVLALCTSTMFAQTLEVTTADMDPVAAGGLVYVIDHAESGSVIEFNFDGEVLDYGEGTGIAIKGKKLTFNGINKKNGKRVTIKGLESLFSCVNPILDYNVLDMSLTRTFKRLVSLDVLRGITVCGMILVNNAGACGYAYAPLKHAKWDGFTPADLVFPAFMFIMGVSIYLSLNKSNFDWRISIARILRRAVLIFVSGVALKWILAFIATGEYNTLENLRIMGVLQRLGICYGIVALLAVTVRHRLFPTIIAVLLVGYYLLQLFGNGFEKCAGNIVSMVDYAVLGKSHMYLGGAQFVDPEGILSTIPAIAQVMIGFLCGKVIVGEKEIRSQIVKLAVWGTSMFVVGYLWSYAAPLNKRLWSPSFVLVTCGITSLIFATLIYIIDDSKRTRWSFPFLVVGVNPLSIYIFSEIAGGLFRKLQWTTISFEGIWQPLFGNYGGSLAYALAFLMFNWLIAFFLYKKHIYIKL